ncbi:hypothetical protein C8Q78DRAFT_1078206 [Trametes maxima]|nr:hypothetical protein C8Q78DRAFT_1078206 [Trametes maxima]
MNAFWDIVDWLLPPVRIVDDLADPVEPAHRPRSNHHHSHQNPQVSRRASTRDFDKERERERKRNTRVAEQDREREQYRQRIQHLERENEVLRDQLKVTREELANLTSAVFPPTPDRTMPPSPCTPQDVTHHPPLIQTPLEATPESSPIPILPPISDTLQVPNSPPASNALQVTNTAPASYSPQTSKLLSVPHIQAPQGSYSAEAALSDPKRLRVLYMALRATYGDARQTIMSQAEELASLKSFLSKTDDWSGAQLLQALADLNSEIIQLSASVAEEFSNALRAHENSPSAAKERDREVVERALGPDMIRLLEDRIHAGDPTLVQYALQAWEVWCVARVLDSFCYGLPMEVDEAFRLIFEHMHREEPQPTTSRWRALTYRHAHTLLAKRRAPSSDPSSPDSANPSPFNSAPASIASSSSLPPPLLNLTEKNLRGIIAILALAGCTDARGLHRDPLRTRFGSALSRISARAERISSVVKTGVMSGFFEAVWVPPHRAISKSRRNSVGENAAPNGAAKSKGKDREREREWVKEVERERQRSLEPEEEARDAPGEHWFDWETMDNMFAGFGNERCRVLCTVELGLAFKRRLPEEERAEADSVDGDGMPTSTLGAAKPALARTRSGEGAGSQAGLGPEGQDDGARTERTLLLKPKVLLESVTDIL